MKRALKSGAVGGIFFLKMMDAEDGAGAAVQANHEEYQMAVDRAVQRVAHALQVQPPPSPPLPPHSLLIPILIIYFN